MSHRQGTCGYIARKDDPSNWQGEEPDDWLLDREPPVGLDQEVWRCPHDALEEREYCAFHTDPGELPTEINESELFIEAINDTITSDDEVARRKKQFIGATFGPLDIEGATLDAGDDHQIRLDHAAFTAGIRAKRADVKHSLIAQGARFDTGNEAVSGEIGAVSFKNARFGGSGDISFGASEFDGAGDISFSGAEFGGGGDVSFLKTEFGGGGRVSFKSAEFDATGAVVFKASKFGGDGDVSFRWAELGGGGRVSFKSAGFGGGGTVSFYRAELGGGGHVSFKNAEFGGGGDISFRWAELGGGNRVSFENAEFGGGGDVSFGWTEFGRAGRVFKNAEFGGGGDVSFENAEFGGGGDVSFRLTEFGGDGDVSFYGVDFSGAGAVVFEASKFCGSGEISFKNAKFGEGGDISFKNAKIGGICRFDDVQFSPRNKVIFTGAEVEKTLTFTQDTDELPSVFPGRFYFSNAHLQDELSFRSGGQPATDQTDGNDEQPRFNIVFTGTVNFGGAIFEEPPDFSTTRFPADTDFTDATLQNADFQNADVTGTDEISTASFDGADLSGVNFNGATLTGASFERALLSRAELLGADLTRTKLYGALLGDTRINRETAFWLRADAPKRVPNNARSLIRTLRLVKMKLRRYSHRAGSEPYCVYDPRYRGVDGEPDLERAAETYGTLETMARQNSLPRLASECFLGRKDVQLKQYWRDRNWLMVIRSTVPTVVARYGESPTRVLGTGAVTVLVCALVYAAFGLVKHGDTGESATLFESFYFSALTFTTLGYGDFNPVTAAGRLLAVAETSIGVVILAILVFVFGRRATR